MRKDQISCKHIARTKLVCRFFGNKHKVINKCARARKVIAANNGNPLRNVDISLHSRTEWTNRDSAIAFRLDLVNSKGLPLTRHARDPLDWRRSRRRDLQLRPAARAAWR